MRKLWMWSVAVLAVAVAGAVLGAAGTLAGGSTARAAAGAPYGVCASRPVTAPRRAANPLALPKPPGLADPLSGAHLFVDGPANGTIAIEIERLLGLSRPQYTDSDTWAAFRQSVQAMLPSVKPLLAQQVKDLFQIGDQPETQSITYGTGGGGPGAIAARVTRILCDDLAADPSPARVPLFTTRFAEPHGVFCSTPAAFAAWWPTFQSLVRQMRGAIGRNRAVILMELGSIGNSTCLKPLALKYLLRELKFETTTFSALPHAVIYLEAGSAFQISATLAAQRLLGAGVTLTRGFFVNDGRFDWAANEIDWATTVSQDLTALLAQAQPRRKQPYVPHFLVNTDEDGTGPLISSYPVDRGKQVACNPIGRGLGRKPTAATAPTFDDFSYPLTDAFVWTALPGLSLGDNCSAGAPAAGDFDYEFAYQLGELANQQLGPLYPSEPYRAPLLDQVAASAIAGTSATFTGMVDPQNLPSTAYFEYGLDPEYSGGGPVNYNLATPVVSIPANDTYVSITATVTGLTPGALYDVRLVATNNLGTSQGPNAQWGAAPPPPPPPPVLGATENLAPVKGVIFIKLPGHRAADPGFGDALSKGTGFVPLFSARQLPSGTQVDARRGTLMLASASSTRHGKAQIATLGGAVFTLSQGRHGLTKGLTTISLLEGDMSGLPSYTGCPKPDADGPQAHAAKAPPKVLQQLKASDNHGRFRTRGRYSSATVRGTEWETTDRCDGTLTTVERGTVDVFDFGTRKTIAIHAGHSYLAKAFRARR